VSKIRNGLLDAALVYAARGWSIVPIRFDNGRKRGAVRWKRFQDIAPSAKLLTKWFGTGKYPALGVILGPVSGNLACRDFDEAGAYSAWAAAHPQLARSLPTVRTHRGAHVYFTAPVGKTLPFGDGELRGARSLCVLPPSPHPKGGAYEWVVALGDCPPPAIEPEGAGMFGEPVERTRTEENRRKPKQAEGNRRNSTQGAGGVKAEEEVELAIAATLPTGQGQRNRAVLRLARALKGIPSLKDQPAQHLRAVVRRWHERALPYIGTKEFEETWIDFLYCWPRIRRPMRVNLLADALKAARTRRVPGCTYEMEELQDLVALCRELQRVAGLDEPFFLSARTAAGMFDVGSTTAWRWLFLLEAEGWIRTHTKGNAVRATRFVWTGDDRPEEGDA